VSQAAIANGRAFVSVGYYFNTGLSVRALDAITGRPLWTNNMSAACSINPPTYDFGSVYVQRSNGDSDSQMWSFNAFTGQTNWRTSFQSQCDNYFAPVVVGGSVFADTGYYGGLTGY